MPARIVKNRLLTGALMFALVAGSWGCSTTGNASALKPGMTPDQTVQAMGQPDLKDSVPDPNHSNASVLRYLWLDQGKAGIFGTDERLASIQDVDTTEKAKAEVEAQQGTPTYFDPINTPLNYAFYPIRAAFIYLGAGLNCIGGGGCAKPHLPPVNQG